MKRGGGNDDDNNNTKYSKKKKRENNERSMGRIHLLRNVFPAEKEWESGMGEEVRCKRIRKIKGRRKRKKESMSAFFF